MPGVGVPVGVASLSTRRGRRVVVKVAMVMVMAVTMMIMAREVTRSVRQATE